MPLQYYKHVVRALEKFIAKMAAKSPQHLLGAAYVVDALCRRSQAKQGDKDKFGPRFAINLAETVANLQRCPESDRAALERVLKLWRENEVIAPRRNAAEPEAAAPSAKRQRPASPRTPPGNPRAHNRVGNTSSSAPPPPMMSGGPPPMMSSGAPPPMLSGAGGGGASAGPPPPMLPPQGPPSFLAAPPASALGMPPPMVMLDFDYDDDKPVGTEESITDAKRRRLEQERRVNESATGAAAPAAADQTPTVPPAVMKQVEDLIDHPTQLLQELEMAGLTLQELILLMQNTPGTERLVAQLTQIGVRMMSSVGTDTGADEEIVEQEGRKYRVRMSTTVYVGGLQPQVTEADIQSAFGHFGPIVHFSHRPDLGTAFVTFRSREEAETAQVEMDRGTVGGQSIKTGWARGPEMRGGEFDKRNGRGLIPIDGPAPSRGRSAPDRAPDRAPPRPAGGSGGGYGVHEPFVPTQLPYQHAHAQPPHAHAPPPHAHVQPPPAQAAPPPGSSLYSSSGRPLIKGIDY